MLFIILYSRLRAISECDPVKWQKLIIAHYADVLSRTRVWSAVAAAATTLSISQYQLHPTRNNKPAPDGSTAARDAATRVSVRSMSAWCRINRVTQFGVSDQLSTSVWLISLFAHMHVPTHSQTFSKNGATWSSDRTRAAAAAAATCPRPSRRLPRGLFSSANHR